MFVKTMALSVKMTTVTSGDVDRLQHTQVRPVKLTLKTSFYPALGKLQCVACRKFAELRPNGNSAPNSSAHFTLREGILKKIYKFTDIVRVSKNGGRVKAISDNVRYN